MDEPRLISHREIPIEQQRVDNAVATFRKSLASIKAKGHETVQNQVLGLETVVAKMEEVRITSHGEIPIEQQRTDNAGATLRKSLESIKAKSHETVQNQARLGKLKAQLREEEDDLVKALAVKTRKEAERMATLDSIVSMKARIAEFKRIVQDQRTRKDEYAAIISQQTEALAASEAKCDKVIECRGEIEEAISWYNRVLGFRIECGHGVKFVFTNVKLKNPMEEYSFTIRHENDIYTLLDCEPHLNDTKELIHELNKSNSFFKFVRTMREKFQEAAACGIFHQVTSLDQDFSTISVSAPASSVSTESRSESLARQSDLQPRETNRDFWEVNHGRKAKAEILSPESALSLRRSPCFKVKK